MKDILFKGSGTAVCTPFDCDGVNINVFKSFLKFQLSNNTDAFIVCGTTGESATLSDNEKICVIKCAVEIANGHIPVIVGTGSNNTIKAISNAKVAESLGADGLLVVTPYYNKCTQYGLFKYFTDVARLCFFAYYFI